jgi:hypothetical protein
MQSDSSVDLIQSLAAFGRHGTDCLVRRSNRANCSCQEFDECFSK